MERSPFTPRFAENPSDALQCRADLEQTVARVVRQAVASEDVRRSLSDTVLRNIWVPQEYADWQTALRNAPIYWWSAETAAIVSEASKSYPIDVEPSRDLDNPGISPPSWMPRVGSAFCVFERPTLHFEQEDGSGGVMPLSAILWLDYINVTSRRFALGIRGITWNVNTAAPVWWSDGGTDPNEIGERFRALPSGLLDSFQRERLTFARWICAASMFIEQEILTVETSHVSRAVRRRIPEALKHRDVHVVRLRRVSERDAARGAGENVSDWSCRWTVRGHWRKQYFPKRGMHAPVWIHPYVKGPDDKPFRKEAPVVYSVSR